MKSLRWRTPYSIRAGFLQHFRGRFLVSFFGRLSTEKAPQDFVKIARNLRSYGEICFLMTGEGQERSAVLSLIERYGLQDRIYAPGSWITVAHLWRCRTWLSFHPHLDGMPLVVFEAQACGKPVVASAVGSIPHVIADGKTGLLCKPGDIEPFCRGDSRLCIVRLKCAVRLATLPALGSHELQRRVHDCKIRAGV